MCDYGTTDLALQTAFVAAMYVDYRQTRVIAENPDLYFERNPLLGDNPSTVRVRNYFLGTAIAHTIVTCLIPKGAKRNIFQSVSIAVELGMIQNNISIGIRF